MPENGRGPAPAARRRARAATRPWAGRRAGAPPRDGRGTGGSRAQVSSLPVPNGEFTREGIRVQPEWLAQVPAGRRFPDAHVLLTGCGTSSHAAQTGGEAVQALELVLAPRPDADLLVLVSHEGTTPLTLEAARAFDGRKWCITGA